MNLQGMLKASNMEIFYLFCYFQVENKGRKPICIKLKNFTGVMVKVG